MAYRYHIFLSYRRYGEWPQWVENIFLPIFTHYLARIIHQPEKSTKESTFDVRVSLRTTASQVPHEPQSRP
jgi:hypothetical protein